MSQERAFHYALEMQPRSATLYLRGALSSAGVVRVARACEEMPEAVHLLRVDLCGVRLIDPAALDLLAGLLGAWRVRRAAMLRVELPRERTFVSLEGSTVGLPRVRDRIVCRP